MRVTIYRNTDLVAETIEKNNGEGTKRGTVNDEEVTKKIVEGVTVNGEGVTVNQKAILDEIEKNARITAQQLAEILHISLRKTKKNIAKLKLKGLIQRIGPDKSGHWKIIKQNNNY